MRIGDYDLRNIRGKVLDDLYRKSEDELQNRKTAIAKKNRELQLAPIKYLLDKLPIEMVSHADEYVVKINPKETDKRIEQIAKTQNNFKDANESYISKNEDIDDLLLEVKNAVDRVPSFPIGMEPLVVAKQEQRQPTIIFSLSGSKVPLSTLKEIGRKIENDLRGIEGISQIRISGYPDEEIEIALNENDLLAYNLTFDEVVRAVGSTNILVTGGNIKTESEEYLIRASNRSYYGRELSNIIVRALED